MLCAYCDAQTSHLEPRFHDEYKQWRKCNIKRVAVRILYDKAKGQAGSHWTRHPKQEELIAVWQGEEFNSAASNSSIAMRLPRTTHLSQAALSSAVQLSQATLASAVQLSQAALASRSWQTLARLHGNITFAGRTALLNLIIINDYYRVNGFYKGIPLLNIRLLVPAIIPNRRLLLGLLPNEILSLHCIWRMFQWIEPSISEPNVVEPFLSLNHPDPLLSMLLLGNSLQDCALADWLMV